MSRYTEEVLIQHAGLTETQLVRTVYPECPASEIDSERSAVRAARSKLIPSLVNKLADMQIDIGEIDHSLEETSTALGVERAKRVEIMAKVATAFDEIVAIMTFGGGIPWLIIKLIGGKKPLIRALEALSAAIDKDEGRKK